MEGEEVKDSDWVTESSWHIARDSLELTYSWDNEGGGKTEVVGIRNIVE